MPDIVDKANDLVSLSEELALREIRSMKPEAVFTGALGSNHLQVSSFNSHTSPFANAGGIGEINASRVTSYISPIPA